jgi:site-specific DNA-methyltransferase (adenine-specific)
MNLLFNDCCFNVFDKIKDKTVDLVLVDLPYGQTGHCWDHWLDLYKIWVNLKRIGKDNCKYIFFTTTKYGYQLIQSNPNWFRYDLVWEKNITIGALSENKIQIRAHEMIYIFSGQGTDEIPQQSVIKFNQPIDLYEWLIKTYTKENDLVLDFCMGTGATIEAAINTKRNYIGIERNSEIFETVEKRINHLDGKPLDGVNVDMTQN